MMILRCVLGGGIAFAVAACSGSSNSTTGTVGGTSLLAADSAFANGTGATTGTVVAISSFGSLCADMGKSQLPKSSSGMSMQLVSNGGAVTAPGTFDVGSQGAAVAFASFASIDASCMTTSTDATGGSVTITSVSSSQLAGTFDLMFGSDHLTGSFSAANCPALVTSTTPTCM